MEQYLELNDARIILGINALFYVTNAVPVYLSLSHILLFHVSDLVVRVGYLSVVVNSCLKFFVYVALSSDFRRSLKRLFCGEDAADSFHWSALEDKSREFLGHAKVAAFVHAADPDQGRNVCATFTDGDGDGKSQ